MNPITQIAALLAALMIPILILTVFQIVIVWLVLGKANQPGWAQFIPIYNAIIFLKVIGKPWWYIFMFIIPIYGWFILPIMCVNLLSKSFGQGVGFTLGLLFLPYIFLAILAFGKSYKYVGPGGVAPAPAA